MDPTSANLITAMAEAAATTATATRATLPNVPLTIPAETMAWLAAIGSACLAALGTGFSVFQRVVLPIIHAWAARRFASVPEPGSDRRAPDVNTGQIAQGFQAAAESVTSVKGELVNIMHGITELNGKVDGTNRRLSEAVADGKTLMNKVQDIDKRVSWIEGKLDKD